MLKKLGVSSSCYYSFKKRTVSNQELRKQSLLTEITDIYNKSHQIYGAPKITAVLRSKGHIVSEKTVGNYMRELGIKAIWVSPYKRTTIDPDFDSRLKNILDRNFNPKAPNTVWVTDVTYIYTLTEFVYLTSVMDLYSRAIVGWHLSDSLSTAGVVKAIENSKRNQVLDNPIIIHSDRAVLLQYIV